MRKLLTLTFIGMVSFGASVDKNPICHENQNPKYMNECFTEQTINSKRHFVLMDLIDTLEYYAYRLALTQQLLDYNINRFEDDDLNTSLRSCLHVVTELLNHELENHKGLTIDKAVSVSFDLYKIIPPEYTMGVFSDLLNGCMRNYLENNNCVQDDISKTLKDCFLKISDLAQKYWEKIDQNNN